MSDAGMQGADGGERRRRTWSADQKQRIIAESFAPGASVAGVARRYSLNSNRLCHSNETRSTNGMACEGPVSQSLSREAVSLDQRGRASLFVNLAGHEIW